MNRKTTFALFFGNRGFFPETLVAGARAELRRSVEDQGFGVLMMEESATRYGAVESAAEGKIFARFLETHRGNYDGIIVCLPNFGDETGAVAAVEGAGVPILVQAYPDEIGKMGFSSRRDAFCGKFSVMDVFCQYKIPFTTFQPHVAHPTSKTFAHHLQDFAAVCRVAKGMKRMTVGAIGARTTAFKTVRFDETTLQRYGITTETLDLSHVFRQVRALTGTEARCKDKAERLKNYTNWNGVPSEAFSTLVKLGVVLDDIIAEFQMDALAIRCWIELEMELKVAPCVLLSEMNDRGIPCACEVDVCSAVTMYALRLASGKPAACLDWNNNYGDAQDKCILFHCGPVPQSLMKGKGKVIDHPMFAKALGGGCGWGPNVGRIAASPMSYASCKTEDGKLTFYLGEGEITDDKIEEDFFGCAGVAHIDRLQEKLQKIGYQGYRHHVSLTFGQVGLPVREAFVRYLNYDVVDL